MLRRVVHKQVNVVVFAVHLDKLRFEICTDFIEDGAKALDSVSVQYPISILCNKDQMNMQLTHTVSAVSNRT
jgi:hypothetical protein